MPRQIVECVPNFSEGRDPAKVDAIVNAIIDPPHVCLLDREMDADHNRCVLTLAGEPRALQAAILRGVGKAAELIDLTRHRGVHPRMGATDVVPFIPIQGVSLDDCILLARSVAQAIADTYGIPTYLYEAAAIHPERRNLEDIRRGQFETIRETIAIDPARRPDFGEPRVHPSAGVTAVGARKPLIAYNVFLNTPDLSIAKKVARAVRFSSGGLRFVKASGFLVRGLAQVSMNLTDFEQTPVHRVFESVRREAARYGVLPLSSEIIGLIPRQAIETAAEWHLQIEKFSSSVILENRIAAVMGGDTQQSLRAGIEPFLDQLAAPGPTPGGGSAAAAAGAMAASLATMIAKISSNKKAGGQHQAHFAEALTRLASVREELASSIDRDAAAYTQVISTCKAARHSAGSDGPMNDALMAAAAVPLNIAESASEVAQILRGFQPLTSPVMASDLASAAALAQAAITGALAAVRTNLDSMKNSTVEQEALLVTLRARLRMLEKNG